MIIEGIYEREVKKFLERNYNLKIRDISYFPIGEDGASYIIKCDDKKYYCKVYDNVPIAYASIQRIKIIMDFLFRVNEEFNFKNAPLPIKNKYGNETSKFNGHPIILYNFINGKNIKKFSFQDYKELGRILSKLHSIDFSNFSKIKLEKLDLKWEKKILKSIKELKREKFHKTSNCGILKQIILKDEELLIKGISFLESRSNYIKNKIENYVIVHNDLHGGNLMKEKSNIFVIDWDGLELALPEKDIMFFSKQLNPNKYFWSEYTSNKKHQLDLKALEYYIVRRFFSDITFFSRVILHTRVENKRFNDYINEIKGDIKFLKNFYKKIGLK